MVKSDAENVMEAEIIGLIFGSSLCDKVEFAWCFRICGGSWQVGATTHENFTVLPFKIKIQGLTLIGCAWHVECIILRVETFFRVKTYDL
jgi:hypothetical protein